MPVDEPVFLIALVVTTAIGAGFSLFAYDLSDSLLSWIGWVGGGGVGGAIGWIVVPELLGPGTTTEEVLLYTAGSVVVGAFVGRIFITLIGRFAVMFAGFVTAFLSVLVIVSGEQMINDLLSLLAEGEVTDPAITSSIAGEQTAQQMLLIAVGAGVVGALIAWQFYRHIITVAITAGGAGLLALVLPAWQHALLEGSEVTDGFTAVSPTWFGVAFLVGTLFQFARHSERVDVLE